MKSLSELSTARGSVLLLGPPGAGKTTLCTQLVDYIVESDGNYRGPLHMLQSNSSLRSDVKWDFPQLTDDMKGSTPRVERWQRMCKMIETAHTSGVRKLALSSMTTVCDFAMDEVRRQQGRKIADGIKILSDDPPPLS